MIREAARSEAVADHIHRRAAAVGDLIERQRQPVCAAVRSRIGAIRRLVSGRRAAPLQPSMFDTRAEVAAARIDDISAHLDLALANREASVASPLATDRVAVQPIAIWQAGTQK